MKFYRVFKNKHAVISSQVKSTLILRCLDLILVLRIHRVRIHQLHAGSD